MYSKKHFGKELKDILKKDFSIQKISQWAERIYETHCRELSQDLDKIIMAISSMDHGSEFEYSKDELNLLAEKLMHDACEVCGKDLNSFSFEPLCPKC